MAAKTGAESVRMLPTLKLFKIRMDLEMEQGTDALSAQGEAVEPKELDPIALSDEDIAVIRATQGPMPAVEEPFAPAAERLGITQDEVFAAQSLRSAGLRRVAGILFHRRAGLGQRHGRLGVPGDDLEIGPPDGGLPRISHC
jgi:hypothetical protein